MKYLIVGIFFLLTGISYGNPYRYSQNVDKVIIKEKVVEYDADYYLGTEGYWQVGKAIQKEALTAEQSENAYLKGKVDALKEIIKELESKKNGSKPAENPVEDGDNKVEPVEPKNKILEIFEKNGCIKCHSSNKLDGELELVKDGKVAELSLAQRVLIHHRVNGVNLKGEGRMPKGGKAVSSEEVEILRDWLVEGAKAELQK